MLALTRFSHVLCCLAAFVPGSLVFAEGSRCGELIILTPEGASLTGCPLRHTSVRADIAGLIGRVTVRQAFHNPTDRKIEALYVFPLPQNAAVDAMFMIVGDRRIIGEIKERGEAREIYDRAKAAGHVAGLLDQERPNIFAQSVANIEPGVQVEIEISYVETLHYEDGLFEWVFPMVVGPRYNPGGGSAPAPMTTGMDTPQVPDGSRITPPVTPKGTRTGHDISLAVRLVGGSPAMHPVQLLSELHDIDVHELRDDGAVEVSLKNKKEIPNRDFVLRYRLGSDALGDAFLTHRDERGTYFTLVLQPPRRIVPREMMPRELIFVLDTSGSMSGYPIEKAKHLMALAIDAMRPGDTFNLITFSGDTHVLWQKPRPNTPENRDAAQAFLASRSGGGGTEMMKAIEAALKQRDDAAVQRDDQFLRPIRVVMFLTDGYVGNDMAIIDAVKKNAGTTRVFSFGIGNSVNRFLLDGMARAGRGEVEYVSLASDGDAAAKRFAERIAAPVLTDIAIDWGTLPVEDMHPQRIPDLFSAKPILVHGRLREPAEGVIRLTGNTGVGRFSTDVVVRVPDSQSNNDAIASLWARAKIESLLMQDYAAAQHGSFPESLKSEVIALGLSYRLMTQFTSFVVVEEMTVTRGGEAVTVHVPVEMPDGVSYEGVFGGEPRVMIGRGRSLFQAKSGAGGFGGGQVAAGQPVAPRSESAGAPVATDAVAREREEDDSPPARPAESLAQMKLSERLRGLAERVQRDGRDGSLTDGALIVKNWRVDVMITLDNLSDESRAKLAAIGFRQTGESRTISLLIGTIDVRELEALMKLDVVIRVREVGGE